MKKRIFAITLGAITLLEMIACSAIEKALAPSVEKIAQVQTSAPLERQYSQMGQHAVLSAKFDANDPNLQTYTVYYPQQGGNYPLIVFANGTGMAVSKYEAVLQHLASYGFVAIGSEEANSWNGQGANATLQFALAQNNDRNSVLFNKINVDRIGVSGHSQGGVGAINLASNQPSIRSVYTASTTKHGLAEFLQWPYDVGRVNVPYFMNAGAHESDAGDGKDYNKGIAPIMSLNENYAKVSAPAVVAQRVGADHGGMLWMPNGYMVAWFLYTLNSDNQAKQVFAGQQAEIRRNANWQNVQTKNIH